jgi:hypothetical protein
MVVSERKLYNEVEPIIRSSYIKVLLPYRILPRYICNSKFVCFGMVMLWHNVSKCRYLVLISMLCLH